MEYSPYLGSRSSLTRSWIVEAVGRTKQMHFKWRIRSREGFSRRLETLLEENWRKDTR